MNDHDIRWKQRFQSFEKAFTNLKKAVNKKDLSELEKAGVIQMYGFTFELAWKTVKDFLLSKDVEVKFPRDVVKEGFTFGVLRDGEIWLDMLHKRNLMSHTYDEESAEVAYNLIINKYSEELSDLYNNLKKAI